MSDNNPFASPEADLSARPVAEASASGISAEVVAELAGTKGWARFLSVLGFIAAGFGMLGVLISMLGVGSTMSGGMGAAGLAGGTFVLVMTLILCLLFLLPALKLWKFASGVEELMRNPSDAQLAHTLNQQRSLWFFVGLVMILSMVITVVSLLGMGALFFSASTGP